MSVTQKAKRVNGWREMIQVLLPGDTAPAVKEKGREGKKLSENFGLGFHGEGDLLIHVLSVHPTSSPSSLRCRAIQGSFLRILLSLFGYFSLKQHERTKMREEVVSLLVSDERNCE